MQIEPAGSRVFTTNFAPYGVVGFHATSGAAASAIERVGFFPHKFFDHETHLGMIAVAKDVELDIGGSCGYLAWLDVNSVTFAKKADAAISHATSGKSGGQGLSHIAAIVNAAGAMPQHHPLLQSVRAEIDRIERSTPVVYAVDLSGLGVRLAEEGDLYRVAFDPSAPRPAISIVDPTRLVARLNL